MKTRIWTDEANAKRAEGCRICGSYEVELAHVTWRKHDRPRTPGAKTVYVEPESVVPLCPEHHRLHDAHQLELLPALTLAEQLRAVEDEGGIELARKRLAPSAYRREEAVA